MTSGPLTGDVVPVEPSPPADEVVMPLVDHLSELRRRLIWSAVAVAIGGVIGFVVSDVAIQVLEAPLVASLPPGTHLVINQVGDAFGIKVKLAVVIGIILAMPVLLWHFWRFVAPGLTASERRVVLPWIPATLAFFALGVGVAYVVLPFAASFLLSFADGVFTPLLTARDYFDFVSMLFLAFGILMEFPVVLVGLSRVGIVTSQRLRRSRRVVILAIAVFSAIATPGTDLVSPTVLGVTLYVLFEITVIVIRRSGR